MPLLATHCHSCISYPVCVRARSIHGQLRLHALWSREPFACADPSASHARARPDARESEFRPRGNISYTYNLQEMYQQNERTRTRPPMRRVLWWISEVDQFAARKEQLTCTTRTTRTPGPAAVRPPARRGCGVAARARPAALIAALHGLVLLHRRGGRNGSSALRLRAPSGEECDSCA